MKDYAKPDQPGYKYARRDPSETREDAIAYLKSQGLNTDEVIANGLTRIKEVEDRIKNRIMKHPTDEEIEKQAREEVIYREEKAFIKGAKWVRDQQPKWNKSCDLMPEFDGDYLCTVEWTQSCGDVWTITEVINCHYNVWQTLRNQKVTHWMPLPEGPSNSPKPTTKNE